MASNQALLAELTSARDELLILFEEVLRKLWAARTAQEVAIEAGLASDTLTDAADASPPVSPAQLADLVRPLEAEEHQMRTVLDQINARRDQAAAGSLH